MGQQNDQQAELDRLHETIANLEAQRAILGDETVDTAQASIQSQIDELEEAMVAIPDPGDEIGGDKLTVGDVKEAEAIAIGRGARAHIVNIYQDSPGRPELDVADFSAALDRYLAWVEERYGRLNLRGVEKREQQALTLSLDEVYVSLKADLSPERKETEVKIRQRLSPEADELETPGTVDMKELLSLGQRLVITGGPGSGKTTYLQLIASSLAGALRTGDTGAVVRHLGLEDPLPLPILIPLSEYNRYSRGMGSADDPRKGTLIAFISHYLIREQAIFGLPRDFFERLLVEGHSCILLLDGLDEVAEERQRWLVARDVENLSHNHGVGTMLVTSRTRAYQGQAVLPEVFRLCAVQPMTPEQVNVLLARWCAAVYDEIEAERETAELQNTITDLESLRQARNEPRLVNSPLLVTIVAIVHYNQRRLPEQRVELYERCVDVLLAEPYKAASPAIFELIDWGGTLPEKRGLLATLAYQMMVAGQEAGRTVNERQLESWLRPRFVRLRGEAEAGEALERFIRAVRERGSLLDERGGRYSFIHLSFQEYLCAYYLAETVREVDKIVAFLVEGDRAAQAWWRETILLVAAYLGLKSEETALNFLQKLVGLQPAGDVNLAAAELAGTALLEMDKQDADTRKKVSQRLAHLSTDPAVVAANEQRALVGRALGWLGDPRQDVNCPKPLMVDIPAGPFMMGSDQDLDNAARDNELPQHELILPDYRIGRYPVTVAQYRRFVETGGYQERQYWHAEGWAWRQQKKLIEPEWWRDPRWTVPNHPVVGVSWFEAVAYCAWLSEVSGLRFRLPDEAMWEKAARGYDGRIYPWGDSWDPDRLNSGEDEVGQTTAVGLFPGGRSPYGLYDCCGNVWEWCSGLGYLDSDYPFKQLSYEEDLQLEGTRALRGGAFNNNQRYVRAAIRSNGDPYLWINNIGFRVVEHLS